MLKEVVLEGVKKNGLEGGELLYGSMGSQAPGGMRVDGRGRNPNLI